MNKKKIRFGWLSRFESIRSRLILTFVLMVLAPAFVIGIANALIGLRSGYLQVYGQLDSVVTLKQNSIESWARGLRLDLENVLTDERLKWSTSVILLKGDALNLFWNTSYSKVNVELRKQLKRTQNFVEFFLVDLDGQVIFSTESSRIGHNYQHNDFFKQGLRSYTIGQPLKLSFATAYSVYAALPVYSSSGKLTGVLVGRTEMSFLDRLMETHQGLGETGETYLVNGDGVLLTNTRFNVKSGMTVRGKRFANNKSASLAASKSNYANYRGISVLGVQHRIPQLNVIMIAEKQQSEAFSSIYLALLFGVMIVIVSVIGAIIIGVWQTRLITAPLADLSSAASKIKEGNLDIQVADQGSTEVRDFVAAFNAMTGRIRTLLKDVKHSERQHAQEKKKAEKASQAKSEFLSSMSHELRTPLNSILGFSQILKTHKNIDEKQAIQIGYIISSGKHLLDLVNGILELSAIESGSTSIKIEEVSFKVVITHVLRLISVLAKQENITIQCEFSEDIHILADTTKLSQILMNLLSNAIKYNCKEGSICIDCKPIDNGFVRISITDTGIGIAEKYHEKVFAPFSRLGLESSSIEGSGVGLLVSKNLAELMNGKLGFTSVLAEGSTFYVDLPQGQKNTIEVNDSVNSPYFNYSRSNDENHVPAAVKQILYVEDNPANQEVMRLFFKNKKRIDLKIAESAEEGWLQITKVNFDLILMDINLPQMSGNELAKRVKADARSKDVPIFAVSAVVPQHNLDMTEDLFTAYITKPIEFSVLDKMVQELFDAA